MQRPAAITATTTIFVMQSGVNVDHYFRDCRAAIHLVLLFVCFVVYNASWLVPTGALPHRGCGCGCRSSTARFARDQQAAESACG
jgi:hypothetical protein